MTSDSDPDLMKAVLESQLNAALINVGMVVGQGVMMERILEQVFCALVGSKFAAVVAAGQNVEWLIGYCGALTNAHSELSEEGRQAILAALTACGAANKRRNEVVHSIHFPRPDLKFPYQGATVLTVKRSRRAVRDTSTSWTSGGMRKVAGELAIAQNQLWTAAESALGTEALRLVAEVPIEEGPAGG